MSVQLQTLFDDACQGIQNEAEALNELSQSIWSNPELCFEERHAHEVLCSFLEKRGFKTERSYTGMETAFRASWDNFEGASPEDSAKAPHCVVISEYDALPEIGHACGHNLIAEMGVAAGLGVKAALEKGGKTLGKITVLGTPAEEGGNGKGLLIDKGVFTDVDIALMVHPAFFNTLKPTLLAITQCKVTYTGFASHASAAPWEGLNALDAVVMAYNGLSALRQQLRPSVRMHAVITKGGVKPNIIPDHTEMEIYVRATCQKDLQVVIEKVNRCFNGAAITTGCEVSIDYGSEKPYLNMIHNDPMVDLFEKHMKTLDPEMKYIVDPTFSGSTDMGNLSLVVPSIHPFYSIGKAVNHSREFTQLTGSPEVQPDTLNQAKAMALVALEVMADAAVLEAVRADFDKNTKQQQQ